MNGVGIRFLVLTLILISVPARSASIVLVVVTRHVLLRERKVNRSYGDRRNSGVSNPTKETCWLSSERALGRPLRLRRVFGLRSLMAATFVAISLNRGGRYGLR